MEPQEKMTTQQFIIDRLHDIQRKAESNNLSEALTSIKEVKAADVKNLYLIAIEKQIAKLNDTSLTPENRTAIIKSLPSMIDRAISDIQRRVSVPKVEEVQKEQKEAALEKLKSQYFQRADDYVKKQEYQRALEEIRRIYIIEPGSVVAKEYEQKIEHLAELNAQGEAQAAKAAETEEQPVPIAEEQIEKVILEEEPKKSKLPLIIAAAVVLLGILTWFFFLRNPGSSTTPTSLEPVQRPAATQTDQKPGPESTATAITADKVKESPPIAATTKQPSKSTKPAEVKSTTVTPVKTPAKKPESKPQPATTQPKTTPVVQPPPEQPKATESGPSPIPFVAIESPPQIVRREPAEYPEIAIKLGMQGRVVVEVTVDAQGKPIQTKVVKTNNEVFNDAAVEAAMKTTYKPGMMSTGPVQAKLLVPFDFRMNK